MEPRHRPGLSVPAGLVTAPHANGRLTDEGEQGDDERGHRGRQAYRFVRPSAGRPTRSEFSAGTGGAGVNAAFLARRERFVIGEVVRPGTPPRPVDGGSDSCTNSRSPTIRVGANWTAVELVTEARDDIAHELDDLG